MSGIQTLIVECNPELSDHPKAISLDDEGLRIRQALGLGSAINHSVLLDINAHHILGVFEEENADAFVSAFQRLLQ